MNRFRHHPMGRFGLLLVAASLWLHALLPSGFMPNAQANDGGGAWLVLCSGTQLQRVSGPAAPSGPAYLQVLHCPFAGLSAPLLPPPTIVLATTASPPIAPPPHQALTPAAAEAPRRPPVRAGPRAR